MNLISNNANYELIVMNSCFICNIGYADTTKSAREFIESIKERHTDSTHNCYAYILKDTAASSDDGEPIHSASLPIMNVLKKHNLINVVCVITRYFGGIKLGVSGLARAYTKCTAECLKNIVIKPFVENVKIAFTVTYNQLNIVENLLLDYIQNDKTFNESIGLEYTVPIEKLDSVKKIIAQYQHTKN